MSTEQDSTQPQPTSSQLKRNRLQLIAILAIVLVPALGSTFMYYTGIGMPTGTNNKGILVAPPIDLNDITLRQYPSEQAWTWNTSGNFRLAVLVDGECNELCTELVHNMRQVHVRLSKRASSLERWLVVFNNNATNTESFINDYPGMEVVSSDENAWYALLRSNPQLNTDFNGHQVILIDRRGHLTMAFNKEQSGQDMLDDVVHLIKSTQ